MKAAERVVDRLRARWRGPQSFTSIIPFERQTVHEVWERIRKLDPKFLDALQTINRLHFFRLVVVAPNERSGLGLRLLLNSVHDGPLGEHLLALTKIAGALLIEALHGAFSGDLIDLPDFLLSHRVYENTFFIGAINKTVLEIQGEHRLREALALFIDEEERKGAWKYATAEAIRLRVRGYALSQCSGEAFPHGPPSGLSFTGRALRLLDLALTFVFFPIIGVLGLDMLLAVRRIKSVVKRSVTWVAALVWWTYGGVFTAIAFLGVRMAELLEPDIIAPPPLAEDLQNIEAAEDLLPRNELTVWFPVRNSWVARILLRMILFGSERGVRHFWTDGRLAGAQNIHFARILQVDGGQSMIFMSDYEGSFPRYIDHFVGVGGHSRAVVPISSRLEGCPKTRWLYQQVDPPTFRTRWRSLIRRYQIDAGVWYSAYPLLSVNDILKNAEIRMGIFVDRMSEAEAQCWVRRF